MSLTLRGVYTALLTPFLNQQVDYESFQKLVKSQVDTGVVGFVINGTTAESPTLTQEEVKKLFHCARETGGPSMPLIVGTGVNSTQKTIEATQWAEQLGASAALVVVPYYNKPPQTGLVKHFKMIAENTSLPIILYNVPGRTITGLELASIKELSGVKNIVAIKEASGDVAFIQAIKKQCPQFTVLSGDDPTCVEAMTKGAEGVISVISHIIPKELSQFTEQATSGAVVSEPAISGQVAAVHAYEKYNDLNKYLYCEPNPIPVKAAMSLMNIIARSEMRLPLVEMTTVNQQKLKETLKQLGKLN